jgi:hypothetical protein
VISHGRFNLCPAPACNPEEGGTGSCEIEPVHTSEKAVALPVEFFAYKEVPAQAVAWGKAIMAAGKLEVGGIEYLEAQDGRLVFYDVNANSNLRPSVAQAFGFDPFERVVDYLVREIRRTLNPIPRTAAA